MRRLLRTLYAITAIVVVVIFAGLLAGVPDFMATGRGMGFLYVVTLLILVVGLIAIIDFVSWLAGSGRPIETKAVAAGVVLLGFGLGFWLGLQLEFEFVDVGPMDVSGSVVARGDGTLAATMGIVGACFAAFLVWLQLGRTAGIADPGSGALQGDYRLDH